MLTARQKWQLVELFLGESRTSKIIRRVVTLGAIGAGIYLWKTKM